ncbi:MAG TPA: hypothetical protein DCO88_08060, partial [Shigella sp.]|nr:hypothetical protein [Shigella sp.]
MYGVNAAGRPFSYAGDKNRQLTRYSDTRWHEDSVRNRWFSV